MLVQFYRIAVNLLICQFDRTIINSRPKSHKMAARVSVLTDIKNQVSDLHRNTYQNFQIKKIDNHYSLYLTKIIFIQRTYRAHLAKKTNNLQKNCMTTLLSLKSNKQENGRLKDKLSELKIEHYNIQNCDQEQQAKKYKIWLQQKLRNALRNIFNSADIFSKNNAMIKSELLTFEEIKKQNQQLEDQHQAIQNQRFLHRQRINKWEAKLSDIRNSITYQKKYILKFQNKIRSKAEQSTTL